MRCFFPLVALAAARPLRIVPLGDSITEGYFGTFQSYRRFLFEHLREEGGEPVFLGSRRGSWDPTGASAQRALPAATWGQDHEGHFGWTTRQVLDGCPGPKGGRGALPGCTTAAGRLSQWLPLYNGTVDAVLVHLGTNDLAEALSHGVEVDAAVRAVVADLRRLLRVLVGALPAALIVIAQIIPARHNPHVPLLNAGIAQLVAGTSSSSVVLVDQFSGVNASTMLLDDGLHPTRALAKAMATRWVGALRPLLQNRPFDMPRLLDRKTGKPWKPPLLWPSGEPIRPMTMIELVIAPMLLMKALDWARDDVRRERLERRRNSQRRELDLEMQAFDDARDRQDRASY